MDTITQRSQSEQRQLISKAQEIQVLETKLTNAEVSLALAQRAQAEAEEKRRIAEESARIAAENLALEQQVDELEEFQSEFITLLSSAVAGQDSVQQVGDRFTFPSEILFATGSDELSEDGKNEIIRISALLKNLTSQIPNNIDWVLRVDGHSDRTGTVQVNNELSFRRARNVGDLLVRQGFAPNRIAPVGFGQYHPVIVTDIKSVPENRRIELSLSSR